MPTRRLAAARIVRRVDACTILGRPRPEAAPPHRRRPTRRLPGESPHDPDYEERADDEADREEEVHASKYARGGTCEPSSF